MDNYLKTLKEIFEMSCFEGTQEDFISSKSFISFLNKERIIPSNLKKSDMSRDQRDLYIDYLALLTQEHIDRNKILSWDDLKSHSSCKKSWKMLFEFGVRGELVFENQEIITEESLTRITFREFYELCQIQFYYDGSFGSFKKMISKKYGSFAEYCLERGHDINNTKWESDETALRVAEKIGSTENIKVMSSSLYRYLEEKKILKKIA
jgi:hypothetical protein